MVKMIFSSTFALMLLGISAAAAAVTPSQDIAAVTQFSRTNQVLFARQEKEEGDDDKDGVRVNATLNTPVTLVAGKKVDVTYPDGFELDVNSTVANTVTVTSGTPSISTVPSGFKLLAKNSWKVTYRTALAAGASAKIEFAVSAAAVTAAGGAGAKLMDTRLAFVQNGAWMVDEKTSKFDADENKTASTSASVKSNSEWTVLLKTSSSSATNTGSSTAPKSAGSTLVRNAGLSLAGVAVALILV
ncbi:uncharacterized protein SPPG_05696 [Spizellomyces punctatus DAOM BR117]|uniref:Uncharacterized protein n=1 Tax=Spizellomyces punctatus (strain DAOM BR117) TaxID=645134 RepID=A0A0L0HEK8_SPIPD|nr:uncharacterized protein SPPG_05696 [Spizellomyces punctatus DAOM BR117]KNC99461.1 hypothetical protein SPPG_05696 [Spizellomyces punctatus DAOM BR117]|eukprot:XP_016607501.1 hypothetical protein SPPG_05696 [Spizellomyces punctatus DAOM BR117]